MISPMNARISIKIIKLCIFNGENYVLGLVLALN